MKISLRGLILVTGNIFRTPAQMEKAVVFYQLDEMYRTCKDIAKLWGDKTIPLNTIYITFKKGKLPTGTSDKYINELALAYNGFLDSLYKELKKIAKKMDSRSVPLSELKNGFNIMKKAYKIAPKK